jgi:autotransporter-associated beta strand protein
MLTEHSVRRFQTLVPWSRLRIVDKIQSLEIMKPKFRSLINAFAPLSRSSLIVCATLCAGASAQAQSGTWTSLTSGGNWSDVANWNSGAGPVADGAGNTANLSTVDLPTGAFTVNLDTSRTIGNINFSDSDAVNTPGTWAVAGATTLTLDSATPTLTVGTGVSAAIAPVVAGTAGLVKAGAGALTLSSANTFTGALTVSAGNLILSNTNAYAGTTTIATGGTLTLGSAVAFSSGGLGAGAVEFTGGALNATFPAGTTLNYNSAINVGSGQTGSINTPNRFEMRGAVTGTGTLNMNIISDATRADFRNSFTGFSGNLNFTGSGTMRLRVNQTAPAFNAASFGTTAVDLGGSVSTQVVTNSGGNTIPIGALSGSSATSSLGGGTAGSPTYSVGSLGTDTVYAGGIIGNAILTKVGPGTLTLTNTTLLTQTGVTNVNEGFLKYNGTKTGTGAVNVASGATLTGTGSLTGTTTVAASGILSPGDDLVASGVGTITHSTLTLATGSFLNIEFGSGNDAVTIASGGTLTLSPNIKVNAYDGTVAGGSSFGTNGSYPIINTTGATVSGFNSSTFVVDNPVFGKVYSFTQTANSINLVVSDNDPSLYWNVDGPGSWGTAANWTTNTVPNAISAMAKIGAGVGGVGGGFSVNANITLDGNRTVGELTLNDDFGAVISINPGISTPGTLLLDNGSAPAGIVSVAGAHFINAPVTADAEGFAVDVANATLTMSGVVGGASASLTKTGAGAVALTGNNTYGGGTVLAGGVVNINSATSLGAITAPASFTGGTLQLGVALSGITRSYLIPGAASAIIDTNGFDYGYAGVIAPSGGGTGGLTKNGLGIMSLSAAQTYTGTTSLTAGVLELATGGSTSGGATNISGGANLTITGGSLIASAVSNITGSALTLSSGSASFNAGLNCNTSNPSSNVFLNLTGGTFSSSFVSMGRSAGIILTPAEGSATAGFYINGAAASIAGGLSLGTSNNTNSSVSCRIDSGSLTVGGAVFVQVNSPDRWAILDVNGGTFTSTDTVTGVQIGSGLTGSEAFLVRAGTATVERILLTQPAASTETSLLNLSGGALYVGAGGILGNNNAGTGILDIQLGTATLGAKGTWSSAVNATLAATTTIKAADVANAPFDITLGGILGGAGGFEKTGGGVLTLSGANIYTGTSLVSAGTLAVTGDNSAATGDVTVATGATLGGNGNLGGNVAIQSGAHHALAVAATPGTQVTRVITGSLTLTSGNILDLTSVGPVEAGVYVLATANGGITGTPSVVNLAGGVTGSVTVSGNNLQLTVVGGSAYDTWATTNGLTALNKGANQDPDFDGVKNSLEFVLGGNPLASSTNVQPTLAVNATNFVFTFNRNDASEAEVPLAFQYGTTLGAWTNVVIGADNATSGPEVNIVENTTSPDTITVTIPKGANTKLFGRLQAVK